MLPIIWGVRGPDPDEVVIYTMLSFLFPHAERDRHLSAPAGRPASPSGAAPADDAAAAAAGRNGGRQAGTAGRRLARASAPGAGGGARGRWYVAGTACGDSGIAGQGRDAHGPALSQPLGRCGRGPGSRFNQRRCSVGRGRGDDTGSALGHRDGGQVCDGPRRNSRAGSRG